MKYITAEKLIAEIERLKSTLADPLCSQGNILGPDWVAGGNKMLNEISSVITSLQQEQPANMIQWTGSNLQEVIDFTGKSPKSGEWFKSWEEFESYVHSHGDILKLFSEDGSHFEVPVGAWIVKTPDGYNVPSVARFIHAKREQPDVDLEKELKNERAKLLDAFGSMNGEQCLAIRNFASHFYELGPNARKK